MSPDAKFRKVAPGPPELLSDWLLGGRGRHAVFERLVTAERGWKAEELGEELGLSRPWVFEIFRALKPTGALQEVDRGRYRLLDGHPLSDALRSMTAAANAYKDFIVERPPRKRGP